MPHSPVATIQCTACCTFVQTDSHTKLLHTTAYAHAFVPPPTTESLNERSATSSCCPCLSLLLYNSSHSFSLIDYPHTRSKPQNDKPNYKNYCEMRRYDDDHCYPYATTPTRATGNRLLLLRQLQTANTFTTHTTKVLHSLQVKSDSKLYRNMRRESPATDSA